VTDNRFENKGGDQNVAQGDGAIGSDVTGNGNIIAGSGDVNAEVHHHHYAEQRPAPDVSASLSLLPAEDDIFLHRETELAWLDEHLHPGTMVAVCAPGGMGKSALAARAVRRLDAARFPDNIIFHTFYHQPATAQAVQTLAHALGIKGEADPEQQVALALRSKQALLILDGAEEAADLRAVLVLRGSCGVLITSRKKTDAGPLRLDLQPLPDDQAENAALLLQRSAAQVGEDSRLVLGLAGCLAFDLLATAPMIALLENDERRDDCLHIRPCPDSSVCCQLLESEQRSLEACRPLLYRVVRDTERGGPARIRPAG